MAEEKLKAKIDLDVSNAIRSLKSYQKHMRDAGTETEKARSATKEHGKDMEKVANSSDKAGKAIVGFVSGFAGLSGAKALISGVMQELEQMVAIRSELSDTAITIERLAQGLAQMRGDVSQPAITQRLRNIEKQAIEFGVTPETAEQALFFGQSQFGNDPAAAATTARSVLTLAAPAQLQPAEVSQLPKLFGLTGARDAASQAVVSNKLNKAAGGSIAKLGEFSDAFVGQVAALMERGFGLDESLALMRTSISVSEGPRKAATNLGRLTKAASGKTETGINYWTEQARAEGLDYKEMTGPERLQFVKSVYIRKKLDGTVDEIKFADSEGFEAFQQFFGETGQAAFGQALTEIQAAGESGTVAKLFTQFSETSPIAAAERQRTRSRFAEARTGKKVLPQVLLQRSLDTIESTRDATKGIRGAIMDTLTIGDENLRRRQFIGENLSAAFQLTEGGSPERARVKGLINRFNSAVFLRDDPDLIGEISEVTGGFNAPATLGGLVEVTGGESGGAGFGGTVQGQQVGPGGVPLTRDPSFTNTVNNFYGFTTVGSRGAALSPTTPQNPN